MDTSITIRTYCHQGPAAWPSRPAAASSADSDPAAEYEETLDKARALIEALGAG